MRARTSPFQAQNAQTIERAQIERNRVRNLFELSSERAKQARSLAILTKAEAIERRPKGENSRVDDGFADFVKLSACEQRWERDEAQLVTNIPILQRALFRAVETSNL